MQINTVSEMYTFLTMEEIHILINYAIPSNYVNGVEIEDIIEWPYCDAIELLQMNDIAILETVCKKRLQMEQGEIMQMKASEFCSFFKHLANEIEKIVEFMQLLKSEPEADLVNAGIEKLDKFGVYNVYYSIDKNPESWDRISEISFNKMFTRLYMDKEHADIQKAYNKIIVDKQNRK